MIYCYLRVSTDTQDVESQKIGLEEFLKKREWTCDKWVEDNGVSGAVDWRKRKLGQIIKTAKKGDVIVFSEISRIARRLVLVLEVIKECTEKGIAIYTAKDRYVMEDTIQSKVLVTVMGLAAEIERDLIRQRTKEGLKRALANGKVLGRRKGSKNKPESLKCFGRDDDIIDWKLQGWPWAKIARRVHVHRGTLKRYVDRNEYIQRELRNDMKGDWEISLEKDNTPAEAARRPAEGPGEAGSHTHPSEAGGGLHGAPTGIHGDNFGTNGERA